MQIELIVFWGFISLLLIVLAELRADFRMLGVIGCILLVPLAFGILTTGIEYNTGVQEIETVVDNTPINLTSAKTLPQYLLDAKRVWAV